MHGYPENSLHSRGRHFSQVEQRRSSCRGSTGAVDDNFDNDWEDCPTRDTQFPRILPEDCLIQVYHPDHLGSTSHLTDRNGRQLEHNLYFPFGESWVSQHRNDDDDGIRKTPYRFTSKELDSETGLYYFGARYYDPRTSLWVSADPILDKYLPTGDNDKDRKLPGIGGVFNAVNLSLYTYAHQKPVVLKDPDGNATTGEIIDQAAMGCGPVSCAGYALASAAWTVLGAESLSKVFDHHALGGREDVSGGDYGWAALDVGIVGGLLKLGKVLNVAKGLTGNPLYKSALGQFKNTKFTNAGRAVTKHAEYFGFKNTEALRKVYNTEAKINELAANTLKDIMRSGKTTTGAGGRYPGGWKTITGADGRAASWHADGRFIGFRGVQ